MAWRSIFSDCEVQDPKADLKNAVSFGAFCISEKAVYLGGREYLPLRAVRRARLYSSSLSSHGCCGLGVPVWYVLLYCGEEKPLKLLAETKEKAEDVLAAIRRGNPDIEAADA